MFLKTIFKYFWLITIFHDKNVLFNPSQKEIILIIFQVYLLSVHQKRIRKMFRICTDIKNKSCLAIHYVNGDGSLALYS